MIQSFVKEITDWNWFAKLTCCFSFSSISKIWYAIYIFHWSESYEQTLVLYPKLKFNDKIIIFTSVPVVSPDCLSWTSTFLLRETSLFITFILLYVRSFLGLPFRSILGQVVKLESSTKRKTQVITTYSWTLTFDLACCLPAEDYWSWCLSHCEYSFNF